jgi:hypothetical protein
MFAIDVVELARSERREDSLNVGVVKDVVDVVYCANRG